MSIRAQRSAEASARIWKIWRSAHLVALSLLGMSLVGGLFMYWHNAVEFRVFPKRFATVEDGRIYRSGQIDENLLRDVLTEHDIQVVIDLAGYEPKYIEDQRAEERIASELGIQHKRLPLDGSGVGDLNTFAIAIAELDRARRADQPVLVHCTAGARRSAAVLAAYLVLVRGESTDIAYQELSRYGSRSLARSPLVPFLNDNMQALADRLVDLGVVDAAPDPIPFFPRES